MKMFFRAKNRVEIYCENKTLPVQNEAMKENKKTTIQMEMGSVMYSPLADSLVQAGPEVDGGGITKSILSGTFGSC